LILLAKVGHLHLLTELANDLVVPRAVLSEISEGPSNDPARIYFESESLPTVDVALDAMVLAWDLGSGESAVLSYAIAHRRRCDSYCPENRSW
jgi:predicted nucleic acid-binding protein